MRRGRRQREVLPAAKQQDCIRTGDSRRRTGMQGNIDLELICFIILTLPTALAASDQDLINSIKPVFCNWVGGSSGFRVCFRQ